jgi:hypothetical protein
LKDETNWLGDRSLAFLLGRTIVYISERDQSNRLGRSSELLNLVKHLELFRSQIAQRRVHSLGRVGVIEKK